MAATLYGDITPRTAAKVSEEFLNRAEPYLVIEKFGQSKPLPSNSTKSLIFRRYNALDATPKYLSEGVTPATTQLTKTDVTCNLSQMGDLIEISDIVADTHEDPVLKEATEVLSEQGAQMVEQMRFGVLKAGTNVYYANGSARTDVNTVMTRTLQRKITKSLKRQNAKKITRVTSSSAKYGTKAVAASYVALCHTDCETDVRSMDGFIPTEDYGTTTPYEMEIGKVEDVRYLASTIFDSWADGGGVLGSMEGTTAADVYPILFLAKDAYAISALKGAYAIKPSVINPVPSSADPLGQRGYVGYKTMQGAVILNDLWMCRAEVAVTK